MASLGVALAAASIGFAPAASASGSVGNCNTWITYSSPNKGNAYCSKIAWGDKFRVNLTCIDPHGKQWRAVGPWVSNTETSRAICSTDRNVGILRVGVEFSA
ncbi:hypothetical protein R1T08_28070 [Streptomyces sp. SBC-4]|nr:hypothetical protein [Streptomyces sp. SBC-4]MDV5147923.1 hypothetical protein [Streptomyces sp. SBC-4]